MSNPKIVMIGLDAPIVKSVRRFLAEGALPNLRHLIDNGVWAENCLVPHPTITPPNWTTIATGAYPGTHSVTCFRLPRRDERPGTTRVSCQAFSSADVRAEYIWEAAERVGRKAVVLNYPTSWPPRMKEGTQVGGFGLHVTEWRITRDGECLPGARCLMNLADHQCVTTANVPLADRIELRSCLGWARFPDGSTLEAEVEVGKYNTLHRVEPVRLYLLIDPQHRAVWGFEDKSDAEPLFVARRGEWSDRSRLRFRTDRGDHVGFFKTKLLELSPDGKKVTLYFTAFCSLDGGTFPAGVAKELEEKVNVGLPVLAKEDVGTLGWVDYGTFLDLIELENRWLGEAAHYLLTTKPWDIFYMHAHTPDRTYHLMLNQLDHAPEPALRRELAQLEFGFYKSLDQMIGRIVEAAGERAVVAVTSDHGVCPGEPGFQRISINHILREAGLLAYADEEGGAIDWSQTRAFEDRSVYIWVNLKSRYAGGIVQDKDFDDVRWQVMNALHSYRDPGTGKCPFAFILRREEARLVGLHGDLIGDIVFGIIPEAASIHGRKISSGEYSIGSMKALLVLSGPGVKRGFVLKRTVNVADLVPTFCYLAELPLPEQCEGGIIYQALEDKDRHLTELQGLRERYGKLEETIRVKRALTHSYD